MKFSLQSLTLGKIKKKNKERVFPRFEQHVYSLVFFLWGLLHNMTEDGAPMNLTDAEYQTALTTVRTAAATVGAEVAIMYEKNASTPATAAGESSAVEPTPALEDVFKTAYVMIRNKPKSVEELLELRVAVVGNVVCSCLLCV